jgi:hypothetical protein
VNVLSLALRCGSQKRVKPTQLAEIKPEAFVEITGVKNVLSLSQSNFNFGEMFSVLVHYSTCANQLSRPIKTLL